jgi:hypothetical protein
MLRQVAFGILALGLVCPQIHEAFAQEKPGKELPKKSSTTIENRRVLPSGVKGTCRPTRVCHDARPLGDYGPPKMICQIKTICDGDAAQPIN